MLTCNLQFWWLETSPALHEGVVPVVKLECGIFLKEFPCLKSLAFESTFHPLERFCCKGFTLGCPYALFSTLLTVPVTHLRMPETGQQHFERKPWKTSVECLLGECWTHTPATCRKCPGRSEVLPGNKGLTGQHSEAQSGWNKKQCSFGGVCLCFTSFPLWYQVWELFLLSKFPGNYILKEIEHNVQVLKYLPWHFPFCLSRCLLFSWHCSDERVMPLKCSGRQESWL